ncbi:hypothetical protein B0O80DRAFT_451492 [Mortierella sp. GBAus27b]|nr:SNF1-interacting protein [Mortierella sp. GBA43]KAI8353765.1 hypothetical protein B0O80DRAFT_451492 [Mortierella sp. GBAus27b]
MPTVPPTSAPTAPAPTEGVSAMIPVANITLEDALLDNPNFRANIKLFEGQVYYVESWLVQLQRSMMQFTDEWKRLSEVTSVLNKQAEVPLLSQGMLSSQYTLPAMKLTGEALRTTFALKSKFISEANEKVLKPLEDFLKTDLKDFKDTKKVYDKALEKYESTLAKYNAQSRHKEPSALREEAFQLYDIRKAYIQAAMSCAMVCIKFQDALDQMVISVFLDLIATQHDYFSGNSDHFGSMALQVLQLKTYMKDLKVSSVVTLQELEQNKDRYVTDAIEYWKPSRSLKCYSNALPGSTPGSAPKPTIGLAAAATLTVPQPVAGGLHVEPHSPTTLTPPAQDTLSINTAVGNKNGNPTSQLAVPNSNNSQPSPSQTGQPSEDFTPTTKQGYLNIRIPQPRNRTPVWKRKYFFIQEGEFGFESVVSNRTVGSQVVQSERISVLLCEVRYGSSSNSLLTLSGGGNPASGSQGLAMVQMERRFCFEVVCVTQTYLLQAETEDDLMSWVNTFEAAKRAVVSQHPTPGRSEPDVPYSPIPDSANAAFSFSGEDILKANTPAQLKSSDQSEETKPAGPLGLAWAANVPGVSLLLASYTGASNESSADATDNGDKNGEHGTPPDSSQTASGTDSTKQDPAQASGTASDATLRLPAIDTGVTTRQRSWSVGDPAASTDQRSGHSQQLSEIEKLMTSSIHLVPKPTPLPMSEIPHYPMELVVRNRELHMRFHGTKVHSKEYVLHSWTSGYRDDSRPDKPIMTFGRIYLTESGMYFYARGLSVETKRMYRFSIIRGIECEQRDITTEWRIETVDCVQHVFCQFTLSDTEYQVLHLIWTNAHQTKDRLPVKELFRRIMLITNKPKGSAGSGSLAETESSHLTNREGTMTHPSGKATRFAEGDDVGSDTDSVKDGDEDWKNLDEDPPSTFEAPSSPVACGCAGHLEKTELEMTFDIPAKALSRLLFGNNSPIWKEFHERRSNQVQSIGEWTTDGDHKTRVVKFLMVVNNPLVKLNQTDCVETQTCEIEEEYLRYSYTTRTSVLAMPYNDAFTPVTRYCITYVNKNQCKLTCSCGIEWHKSPLVKAMIRGAVFKGTAETIKDVAEIIQLHLERRKRKARRSVPASGGENGANNHARVDSAKITISLHGPDDDDAQRILLNPQDGSDQLDPATDGSKNQRGPGIRRHTVSAGSGSGGVAYSGPRVQGQWPTGSQPLFVPVGSKASRTRLLGKPSRSNLVEQAAQDAQKNKAKAEETKGFLGWCKRHLWSNERSKSAQLLYIVLLVSSLINIWAAYNTQRMMNSSLGLEKHGSDKGSSHFLKGYSEPLYRLFNQGHMDGATQFDSARNVRVAARAVYLKDLEELMQSGELEGFDDTDRQKIDQKCFDTFLEVRDSFRSWPKSPLDWSTGENDSHPTFEGTPTPSPDSSAYQDSSNVTRFPWLLPQHRRWATWIVFQRDRVGILRHDLMVTFGALRQLERRLLETEYVNWIMDERSRCHLWEQKRAHHGVVDKFRPQEVQEQGFEVQQTLDSEQEEPSVQLLSGHAEDEDTGDGEKQGSTERTFEDQVAKEFCESLERQVEMFMLDKKYPSDDAV